MALAFKKAARTQIKIKLAISGPSGAGKTKGAIALAKGLGQKVAVLDTENGSASTPRWGSTSSSSARRSRPSGSRK
jgi:hypothetical protein